MISGIGSSGSYSYQKQNTSNMFNKIDSNQDGKIDKSELESTSQNTEKSSATDDIFSKIDTDQDDSISQEEHDAFIKKLQENTDKMMSQMRDINGTTQNSDISNIFSNIDSNQDGSIDETEFEAISQEQSNNTDTSSKVFSEMDTNEDDTVSQDELEGFMDKMQSPPPPMGQMPGMNGSGQNSDTSDDTDTSSKIFSEMDTNQDGTVSQDELEAFLDKMKPQMADEMSGMNSSGQNLNTSSSTDTSSKVFSEMDTNQDGTVSQDELEAYTDKINNSSNNSDNNNYIQFTREIQQYVNNNNILNQDTTNRLSYTV